MASVVRGGCPFCGEPTFHVSFFLNDMPLSSEQTERAATMTIACATCKGPALQLTSDFAGHLRAKGVSVCETCTRRELQSLDRFRDALDARVKWLREKGVQKPPPAGIYPIGSERCSNCSATLTPRWWWSIIGFGMK